jgi:hypothetical protein
MLDTENGWDSNRLQKKWSGSTYNSIMAAVNRHNSSECGGDCPIPDDQVLITSSLGPRGGSRWVATDRKANAEFKAEWAEARRVKEEANRAEYYARQAAQNNVGDVSENPTDEVGKALHDEDGRYHSIDDLPARTLRDGTKEWRSHGILNREHGPAVERGDGTKEWFKHGQRHCVVGPAVVNADGTEEFWIEDEKVDEDVWELYRE